MSGRNEAGSVTAFVAAFTVALLAVAGLVVDGGYLLAARQSALAEAEAAARAGAQAVDVTALRAGSVVVVGDEARRRVAEYLARSGHEGEAEVAGDMVTVRVRVAKRLAVLGLFGVAHRVIEASGSARGAEAVGEQG